jgi:NADPH-dependent 2,4-dienoyl-CoA reductase/sulfur reductase-like enzyme/nitrite reductase/ring-hydroxylating ferredoxin subunit
MPISKWKRLAALDEIPEGNPAAMTVGPKEFLVFRRGNDVFARSNVCPHHGAPLSDGIEHDGHLICPWHTARFDLESGAAVSPPARDGLTTFAVKVEDGEVFIGKVLSSPEIPVVSGTDPRVFVILGAGPAGTMAAETLRREGFAGRIVLVNPEADLPYDRTELSKGFLSGDMTEGDLSLRDGDFYAMAKVELLSGRTATRIDPSERLIVLDDNSTTGYDKLLVATGARPRALDVPGSDLPGVHLLRSMTDARRLSETAEGARSAVVVGASFIGLETAAALRERNIDVTVVAPEAEPLVAVFGPRVGARLRRLHEAHGVRFRLGTTVRAFHGESRVRGVELEDGGLVQAELVVVGVGVTPNAEPLLGTGLTRDGAVEVNRIMQTADPNVFAAGDVARMVDERTGEGTRFEHWAVAERQGMHAARAMAGEAPPYDESPFFWTMQFGEPVLFGGSCTEPEEIVYRGDVDDGAFLAGFVRGGDVCAVVSVGMNRQVLGALERLRAGIPVTPVSISDSSVDLAVVD